VGREQVARMIDDFDHSTQVCGVGAWVRLKHDLCIYRVIAIEATVGGWFYKLRSTAPNDYKTCWRDGEEFEVMP
jgi:hypothetical protein